MMKNANAKAEVKKAEAKKEQAEKRKAEEEEKEKNIKIKINKHFECYNCHGLNHETYDCINY